MRRTSGIGLLALTLIAVLSACASSGAGSGAPSPTPPQSAAPAPTSAPTDSAATRSSPPPQTATPTSTAFTLTSTAFVDGGAIPVRLTCDGASTSPALEWSGAPAATGALALTVLDPDANGFVHWLIYDIPGAAAGSLPEGITTSSPIPQGLNGAGKAGYTGPCPPSGVHRYVFTLYALDGPLGLQAHPHRAEVETAMQGHILAKVVLTATYQRH
jgi:Raf kinase inhibitor-like YbhB/YbcL family protein